MKLRAIEAIRYGALRDTQLGPLGDGLTVVVGPNEAGKSTFASLARHVLFGYSRKTEAERGYHLDADEKRAGRLVFEDDEDGRWVLMRTDGTKRGTPELAGPEGQSDAQAFIERVSAGVSPEVYRQVFGFGLEELADFKSLDAIQDHLHAGVTGLESNPRKALAALEERAADLYLARGRRRINELDRDLKDVRKRRRELSRAAGALTAEREELAVLETRLAEQQALLDEAAVRSEHMAALFARIDTQTQTLEATHLEIKGLERTIEGLDAEIASTQTDHTVLSQGPEIEALLARVAEYETRSGEHRELEREAQERRSDSDALAAALGDGWSGRRALEFQADPARESAAEEFAVKAERYAIDTDSAATAADRSRAVLAEAEDELRDALASVGLDESSGPEGIAAARAETDRALSATGPAPGRPVAALVLAVIGAVVAAWGLYSGDTVTAIIGGAAIVAAAVLWALKARGSDSGASGDTKALLTRKGCLDVASERSKETARLRRQLAADEQDVSAAREQAQSLAAEWEQWCARERLDGSRGPSHAREIARTVSRLAEAARRVEDAERESSRARQATRAFEASARDLGIGEDGASPEALIAAVQAAGARLAAEQERQTALEGLADKRERATEDLAARNDARVLTEGALSDLLGEAGVDSAAQMEGEVGAARQNATSLRDEVAELSARHGELAGRIEAEGKGDEQARLSLQESELTERLAQAIEEYAVAALAVRLLSETLAQYERDRQPEVIRRASEAFSSMTGGRYTRISTPLGEFDPTVFDASDRHKGNEKLSTGTAQQLYLALRLAYIESLGDRAPALPVLMDDILVNFDDDRRARTAELLLQFAEQRQVVLFTCHESTADELLAAADSGPVSRVDL